MTQLCCPHCSTLLQQHSEEGANVWRCSSCLGFSINLAVLRTRSGDQVASALWTLARSSPETALSCPSCRKPLRVVQRSDANASVQLDMCMSCQLLWFDQGE